MDKRDCIKTKGIITALILLYVLFVKPETIQAADQATNFVDGGILPDLEMIWMYGAPNSAGSLGADRWGNPISTAQESCDSFYYWTDRIESVLGRQISRRADLILLSDRGYNRLVEDTAVCILETAYKRGRNDITVSMDIHANKEWSIKEIDDYIRIIFVGASGYLSKDYLDKYGSKTYLSLDIEMPVFDNGVYVHANEINRLYDEYMNIRGESAPPQMYLYNFVNMIALPLGLNDNIINIYDGINVSNLKYGNYYQNALNALGDNTGIYFAVLPHLGYTQRLRGFPEGNIEYVIRWLDANRINPSILAFS